MKTIYYGLDAHEIPADKLSDRDLLREIVTLSRVLNYVGDLERRSVPDPIRMRNHYGHLLSDGVPEPLVLEAYGRRHTSHEIRDFFIAFHPRHEEVGCDDMSNRIICLVGDKMGHPSVMPYYGQHAPLQSATFHESAEVTVVGRPAFNLQTGVTPAFVAA